MKDDVIYICENGAMVIYKGKILHKDTFDRVLVEKKLHSILNKESVEVIDSGEKTCYIQLKRICRLYDNIR